MLPVPEIHIKHVANKQAAVNNAPVLLHCTFTQHTSVLPHKANKMCMTTQLLVKAV